MSGHSKWAQIKRQKGITDVRRGQLFTKLAREITVAVRQGGSDPEHNSPLRLVVQKAREHNMPSENIDRAIKRAAGEGEGANLIEATFEGYGPGGVAILLQVVSDNRNRALQEIRHTLSRGGGSLGEAGCVAWLFETKGVITIESSGQEAEEAALYAIDAGAEEVKIEKGYLEIYTKPEELDTIRKAMERKNLSLISSDIPMLPKITVELEEKTAWQALKLLDQLEELDDVQRVFSNIDFSDEVLEKLRG